MAELSLPLVIILFFLGAAFLFLATTYLSINESKTLYDKGLQYITLAEEACEEKEYDLCLQNLREAELRLLEASTKLNRQDPTTSGIYNDIQEKIDEVDLMIAFVSFTRRLGEEKPFQVFRVTGVKEDPCRMEEQVITFLESAEEFEEDVQAVKALAGEPQPGESESRMLETVQTFAASKEMIEALEPAFKAACTIKTDIEPQINTNNDQETVNNLKGDQELDVVEEELQTSLEMCRIFARQEKAELVNFTLGECSWIQSNLNAITDLKSFLSNRETTPAQGFTASKMFVTMKDYSDLITVVDPLNDQVRTKATLIAKQHPGEPNIQQAKAIFEYMRDEIAYLSPPLTMHQRVQKPEATIELEAGNCADKSVLAASLYMAVGYPVKAVLQDRFHTPEQIEAGAPFTPDHMFVRVKIDDEWYNAEVTCSTCEFDTYTSVNSSTLLEMTVPMPV